MALCGRCQHFADRLFRSDPVERIPKEGCLIHRDYAELSACADSFCNLCKYFRRELWFDSKSGSYSHRCHFKDRGFNVRVCVSYPDPDIATRSLPWSWWLTFGNEARTKKHWTLQQNWPMAYGSHKDTQIRGADPMLEEVFDMGRKWLATCCDTHEFCGPTADDATSFLPTRLLDVGLHKQEVIRLVRSSDLSQTAKTTYVTLSYCWGDKKNAACTTNENLAKQMDAISVKYLPQTIQDAVMVTRAFGVRYLWVDALCIVQVEGGVNEDWQTELAKMGNIYRHSLFTIAASSAESSSIGLFSRIKPACWPVRNYLISGETSSAEDEDGFVMEATLPDWKIVVESSALSKRGWVLQERMSASRSLFWTEEGVFWQCNQLMISEYGSINPSAREEYPTTQEISAEIKAQKAGNVPLNRRSKWIKLVERYSEKVLTVPTDRLPAITGLGTDIARLSGVKFSMGIFDHNLRQELAWFARYPHSNAEHPGTRLQDIPSWSWASLNEAVKFHDPYDWLELDSEATTELMLDGQRVRVRACSQSLRVTRSNKPLPTGYDLSPRVISSLFYTFEPITHQSGRSVCQPEPTLSACIVFDTLLEALPEGGGTIECIRWIEESLGTSSFDKNSQDMTSALVVVPVEGVENTYRRRGWLEIEGRSLFKDEPRNIVLV